MASTIPLEVLRKHVMSMPLAGKQARQMLQLEGQSKTTDYLVFIENRWRRVHVLLQDGVQVPWVYLFYGRVLVHWS